jgi:peroxiredoxin
VAESTANVTSGWLAPLGVPLVRNHPEGYVIAFAVATALAGLAGARAGPAVAGVAGALSLRIGERPPDFTLPDATGRPVTLADYRGRKGLGAELSEAERAGVEIVAISPDPNERSQKVADGLRLRYRFLADPDLAVTRRYGLVHAGAGPGGQDLPRPATVVLDRDGVVP